MDWNRWYSLKSYLRSSLWAVPLIAVAIYAVVKPLTEMLGRWMIRQAILDPKTGFLGLSMTGARSLLGDIVSADLGFLRGDGLPVHRAGLSRLRLPVPAQAARLTQSSTQEQAHGASNRSADRSPSERDPAR